MASIVKRKQSPFHWTACFTSRDGRQFEEVHQKKKKKKKKKKKTTSRSHALQIALELERVETKRRALVCSPPPSFGKCWNEVSEHA